jgi:hypothetical protein
MANLALHTTKIMLLGWFLSLGWSESHAQTIAVDTIYANTQRNTIIMFDQAISVSMMDLGTKDYAGAIRNENTVLLKAQKINAEPTSIFIRYGDKFYAGTIAYSPILPNDGIVDFRNVQVLPEAVNPARAITPESDPIEKQVVDRRIGILEGMSKDRIKTVATLESKEKLTLKLSDIMQDDNYLYVKLGVFNGSKIDYHLDMVEFMYVNRSNEKEYKREKIVSSNHIQTVSNKDNENLIYCLPKFNISSKWELEVTVREKEGVRKIIVSIPYNEILKAPKF